jgi:uncharacterized protein YecT (DUF1311 family)
MKNIALAFTLLLIASPPFAQEPACPRNAGGVFENVGCATAALKIAERELADTYARVLALLPPPQAAALRKAQNAWLSFAAENARFVEMREGTGPSGRLVIANSREKLTRERILELESWFPR